MHLPKRAITLASTLALTAGLSLVAVGAGTAEAATAPPANQAACDSATSSATTKSKQYNAAKAAETKQKKKVKATTKKRNAAKKHHKAKAVKKYNKQLKAQKKVLAKKHKATVAAKSGYSSSVSARTSACAPKETGAPLSTTQITQVLNIFNEAGSGGLTPEALQTLLVNLFPGQLPELDADALTDILAGLNGAGLGDQLDFLKGAVPGFQGLLTPQQVQDLIDDISSQLTDFGSTDPADIQQALEDLIGSLSDQLGLIGLADAGSTLTALLTSLAGSDGLGDLDAADFPDVLDSLLPGLSDALSTDQIDDLFALVTSGDVSQEGLQSLLTGLSADDISDLFDASATEAIQKAVLGQLLPQLNGLAGGGLTVPDTASLDGVLGDLTDLLGSVLGGLLCVLVPSLPIC